MAVEKMIFVFCLGLPIYQLFEQIIYKNLCIVCQSKQVAKKFGNTIDIILLPRPPNCVRDSYLKVKINLSF
ncbi:hypothetical protein THRCLA_20067 [Thraustotheca clavata]|uniref:Uncharacterized protein n=1 Tax=Thraustotheca clavata TaxID=74557 RepID=A0A1W0ACM0_9STRA|nr:hypothetical protein THRCLA_20067 [Thraustotheca clavata]